MVIEMDFQYKFEQLGDTLKIAVTKDHKFGTDAFLLSDFAGARRKDIVCDFGTGCGIIPLLWFRQPNTTPTTAYALDIQTKAIDQLKLSIAENNLQDKLIPLLGDLNNIGEFPLPFGRFDLVTCNPPYKIMDRGIISESSADKIARHESLCTLDDVAKSASKLLKFGGRLCICQRPERLYDGMNAMVKAGIEPKRLRFVQKRGDTAPWLFLLEGKKGSKPFLQVEPPFIVQDETGGFSQELKGIYYNGDKTKG